jgi:hypothetical protein
MDALFSEFPVKVQERSSAGLFYAGGGFRYRKRPERQRVLELIVEKEIAFTKIQVTLDCGMNIIYVVKKL